MAASHLQAVLESEEAVKTCEHTPCPTGYIQWHFWAEKMSKTHDQKQCPECGLWAIWVLKQRRKNAGKDGGN